MHIYNYAWVNLKYLSCTIASDANPFTSHQSDCLGKIYFEIESHVVCCLIIIYRSNTKWGCFNKYTNTSSQFIFKSIVGVRKKKHNIYTSNLPSQEINNNNNKKINKHTLPKLFSFTKITFYILFEHFQNEQENLSLFWCVQIKSARFAYIKTLKDKHRFSDSKSYTVIWLWYGITSIKVYTELKLLCMYVHKFSCFFFSFRWKSLFILKNPFSGYNVLHRSICFRLYRFPIKETIIFMLFGINLLNLNKYFRVYIYMCV